MTPQLDLASLRRQYPDMPGWGERVFLELEAIKDAVKRAPQWTAKDVTIVCGAVVAVITALKGGGAI